MIVATLMLAAAGAVAIPETNGLTLKNYPLRNGEIAYIDNTNGTATAYIGSRDGNLRVTDPYTLHAYQIEQLPRSEYAIAFGSGITYSPSNDVWSLNADATNEYIFVSLTGDRKLAGHSEYCESSVAAPNPQDNVDIKIAETNNMVVIHFARRNPGWAYVSNICVWAESPETRDCVNDLTVNTFWMRDKLGEYDLNELRDELYHHYDGNRGEDWSKYVARHNVNFGSRRVEFDAARRYTMRVQDDNNFHILANGRSAFRIIGAGGAGELGIHISGFARTNTTVTLTYEHDITDFDPSQLAVYRTTNLDADFDYMADATVTSTTITLTNQTASMAFYRVNYNAQPVADICSVVFDAPVTFENALYLRGEDSELYKISVSGGVLSATAVND